MDERLRDLLGSTIDPELFTERDSLGAQLERAKVALAALPALSLALKVTVVTPSGNTAGASLLTTSSPSTASVALALAQREMRSKQHYQHPYYWAPFILVGDSRERRHQQS